MAPGRLRPAVVWNMLLFRHHRVLLLIFGRPSAGHRISRGTSRAGAWCLSGPSKTNRNKSIPPAAASGAGRRPGRPRAPRCLAGPSKTNRNKSIPPAAASGAGRRPGRPPAQSSFLKNPDLHRQSGNASAPLRFPRVPGSRPVGGLLVESFFLQKTFHLQVKRSRVKKLPYITPAHSTP